VADHGKVTGMADATTEAGPWRGWPIVFGAAAVVVVFGAGVLVGHYGWPWHWRPEWAAVLVSLAAFTATVALLWQGQRALADERDARHAEVLARARVLARMMRSGVTEVVGGAATSFWANTRNETYGSRRTFFNVRLVAWRDDGAPPVTDEWERQLPGDEPHQTFLAPRAANETIDQWHVVLTFEDEDGRRWRWDESGATRPDS
jgi:hypothetical protein